MEIQASIHVSRAATRCTDASVLCWMETHPGLAAWVQAAGVLATIMLAVLSPWWVHRMTERRLDRHAKGRATLALARANGLVTSYLDGLRAFQDFATFSSAFPYEAMDDAKDQLRLAEAEMTRLPMLVGPLAAFRLRFNSFVQATEKARAKGISAAKLNAYKDWVADNERDLTLAGQKILAGLKR